MKAHMGGRYHLLEFNAMSLDGGCMEYILCLVAMCQVTPIFIINIFLLKFLNYLSIHIKRILNEILVTTFAPEDLCTILIFGRLLLT